jgi:hypothetical protein
MPISARKDTHCTLKHENQNSHERIGVGHVDQRLANAGDEHNRAKRIDREAAGTDGGK